MRFSKLATGSQYKSSQQERNYQENKRARSWNVNEENISKTPEYFSRIWPWSDLHWRTPLSGLGLHNLGTLSEKIKCALKNVGYLRDGGAGGCLEEILN